MYFIGPNAKKRSGVMGGANNGGYDDDQGSYIHVPHDHISYRYEVLKVIGKGSFGQVTTAAAVSTNTADAAFTVFLLSESKCEIKTQIS